MFKRIRQLHISLAAKCQLLFGAAVVLIIAAALLVPWQRMEQLMEQTIAEARRRICARPKRVLLLPPDMTRAHSGVSLYTPASSDVSNPTRMFESASRGKRGKTWSKTFGLSFDAQPAALTWAVNFLL